MKLILLVLLTFLNGNAVASQTICSTMSPELRRMVAIDQLARQMLSEAEMRSNGGASEDERRSVQRILAVDRIHGVALVRFLEQCGWPRMSVHGEATTGAAWILMQHARPEVQKRFLPQLEKRVAEKEAPSSDLAYLTDRILVSDGKEQLYGTQMELKPPCEFTILPIKDPEKVEERRAKLGMPPLWRHNEAVRQHFEEQGCKRSQ